jgi:predicted LPLAT superfamily acyltransferase
MKHWSEMEERGIIWGMQALLKVYLLFGRKVLQLFLYPVVSYYWLTNSKGRQASIQYLQRASAYLPENRIQTGFIRQLPAFHQFCQCHRRQTGGMEWSDNHAGC